MPELRAVPFALTLTVPDTIDPLDVAQAVADAVHDLERAATGEHYAASAEFAAPYTQPEEFELIVSGAHVPTGYRLLFLAGLVWARRTWDAAGAESDAVMVDARRAAVHLCAHRWPQADPPVGMPLDLNTVQLAATSGRLARTTAPETAVAPPFSLA